MYFIPLHLATVGKSKAIIPTHTDKGWELMVVDGAGDNYFTSPTLVQNFRYHNGNEQMLLFRPSTDKTQWVDVVRENTSVNSKELMGTHFIDQSDKFPFKKVWETVEWRPGRAIYTETGIERQYSEKITLVRVEKFRKNYRN